MTTAFLLVAMIALTAGSIVLTSSLLWLGARLARVPEVSFRRAVAATLLAAAVAVPCQLLLLASGAEDGSPILALAILIAQLGLTWLIIQRVFRTSYGRAILAWLPTLAATAVAVVAVTFLLKPLVIEAYSIPTNGMAPTIAGEHFEAPCPHCRGMLIMSPPNPHEGDSLGICTACFRMSRATPEPGGPLQGDRILALKFLEPKRWDLIVFRSPENPSVVYVKRLIGLPGEEVAIRDGEIVIDQQVLAKPAQIEKLAYAASPFDESQAQWGPVRLGDDEYFVLGDFTLSSADARTWRRGAAGHPAYALPRDHIVGVVTHTYWPPTRWRTFR